MKRLLFIIYVLVISLNVWSQTYWTPDNLPMVHLQDRNRYVINPDGELNNVTVDSLDVLLRSMETETGVQSVVVVVKHIEGDDPYAFGQEVADKYGIGHKGRDDGLFVMICTEDRSYTILTGRGLEGTLPDAVCRRIQNRMMIPRLQEQDYDGAIMATMTSIDSYIRGDERFKQDFMSGDDEDDEATYVMVTFAIIFIIIIIVIYLASVKKCPKCGKRKMKAVKSVRVSRRKRLVTYRCQNCGYEKDEYMDIDSGSAGLGGGMMIGGGMRGFGGGGRIGGSFGGGSFGGGGSTGRW